MARIYTGAGHGGKDSGAVWGARKEKDFNLEVTLELNKLLRQAGHEVKTYRETDTDNGLNSDDVVRRKVKEANAFKADYVVDVHFNAFKDGAANGTEVFHYTQPSKGTTVANTIVNRIASELGLKNRGAKASSGYGIINDTTAPANLVECAFLSSDSDMSKYSAYKFAKAIAQGICDVFGGTIQAPQPTPTPQPQVDEKQKTIDHLNGQINVLNDVISSKDRQLANKDTEIKAKDTQLAEAQVQITALNANNQTQLDKLGEYKVELNNLQVEKTKLLADIDELKAQLISKPPEENPITETQAVSLVTRFFNFIKNLLKG